jgi:integrase/recombinase XerD
LDLSQLDADLINGFLTSLHTQRHNSIATRNARLAAVHSFLTYASRYHPEHLDTIGRVLAIPPKRTPRTEVCYLTHAEVTALLTAPDRTTRAGRRDHAMFQLAVTAGLRVSELTALQVRDVHLAWVPTCSATAKAARTASHRCTARPCKSSKRSPTNNQVTLKDSCSPPAHEPR